MQGLITSIKKEPENEQETKNNVEESKQREEPKAGRVNVGLSTVDNNLVTALYTDSEQVIHTPKLTHCSNSFDCLRLMLTPTASLLFWT